MGHIHRVICKERGMKLHAYRCVAVCTPGKTISVSLTTATAATGLCTIAEAFFTHAAMHAPQRFLSALPHG